MPCILNIETATEVCSVVVSDNDNVIFQKEELKGPSHAVLLGSFVDEAVRHLRSKKIKLDAVAVSCGPGSYTGLRIGVSEAKGLCFGMGIPLIAINTLHIMASGVLNNNNTNEASVFCPMIDARRMEVYDVLLDSNLKELRPVSADIINEDSFTDILDKNKVLFFGNGAGKCRDILKHSNAIFLENIYPHAKDMIRLANKDYSEKRFVDTAYFEPFYLKEFVATIPKNKVLHSQNK